jgi:hypothetical protein
MGSPASWVTAMVLASWTGDGRRLEQSRLLNRSATQPISEQSPTIAFAAAISRSVQSRCCSTPWTHLA